ncbi:unnamed protein product [Rhizophagus irregularis]|nr:unnamed protein product [Rhizophagus irregularis]
MSRRKQSKPDSEISSTEKIDLIFSQKHTYPVTKSQLLSDNEEKITKFVEDTLRYINSFNYPYEMFYYEKNEEETCHLIRSYESDKSIGASLKALIKTDKGNEIEEVYFLADKKRGIITFAYYNIDLLCFILFALNSMWFLTTLTDESRYLLYISAILSGVRLRKYIRF